MLLVLSPSKTLDFPGTQMLAEHTQPEFLDESQRLVEILRGYSPKKLSKLMDISDRLATLNVQRYRDFRTPFTRKNARPAILAFKGDVYDGIEVEKYKAKDFAFAQEHIRILSGLYGLLKPLDLIQPYRLEMGIGLRNKRGKNLYGFWGERITDAINGELAEHKTQILLNLASEEYFAAVRPEKLKGELIHVIFKENQKGKLKIIGLFAKKARGFMADYIVKNRIDRPVDLKSFKEQNYLFDPSLSDSSRMVFIR